MNLEKRIQRKSRYQIAISLYKTKLLIDTDVPLISFTFDDFPISAKRNGAFILDKYSIKGTFYTSLNHLNADIKEDQYYKLEDLNELINNGHEIGCHTYDHLHAEKNSTKKYLNSIIRNREKFNFFFPNNVLESFSYPFGGIKLSAKKNVKKFYLTARTNWAGINIGNIDLHLLKANKLYSSSVSIEKCKNLIDWNRKEKGWLIFYTHDVRNPSSEYGCTLEYFETIVKYAVESGSVINSIARNLEYVTS